MIKKALTTLLIPMIVLTAGVFSGPAPEAKQATCLLCGGTGRTDDSASEEAVCPRCGGSGLANDGVDSHLWNEAASEDEDDYFDDDDFFDDDDDYYDDDDEYADYEEDEEYTITYKLDGGVNNAGNPAKYTETTATITLKNPTKKGYTFKGWFSDSQFTKKVTQIAEGSTGNKTLYAKWSKNTYKINYRLNGGTNHKSNPATYTVTTATVTLKDPTRKGYAFKGWYSDSGFKTKAGKIAKGSTGDKTFYAKWEKTYTITYKLNGGKNHAKNPKTYTKSGATVTLKNPTRKGYDFKGWYSDQKLTKKVTKITKGSTGNKTLYAKWSKSVYPIAYVLNGGTNHKSNPKTYTITTATITLKNPTRKGYAFKGWYSDQKLTKKSAKIAKGSTGKKTFYAKWAVNTYTITYNLNGGVNNAGNPKTYTVQTADITLRYPTRRGYTFIGWYRDASLKTRVAKIAKGSAGNLTLYAKWSKNTYFITYELYGGKNSKNNPNSYTVTSADIILQNPIKKGYVLEGWYREPSFKTRVTKIASGSVGNMTLYAKWKKVSFTYDF